MKRNTFQRLIKKYEIDIQLIYQQEGSYIDGEYVKGLERMESRKVVITPISERKAYDSGGSYTTQDFQLISSTEINLEENPMILHKEKRYKLEPDGSYDNYVDVYNYIMKRVDNFDRTKANDSCLDNGIKADFRM